MSQETLPHFLREAAYIGWMKTLPRGRWYAVVGGSTRTEASIRLFQLPAEAGRMVDMITLPAEQRP